MAAVSGLGIAFTAETMDHGEMDHNNHWPFFTLSNFQQKAGNARGLSKTLYIAVAPLVERENFEAWDQYVNGPSSYWT